MSIARRAISPPRTRFSPSMVIAAVCLWAATGCGNAPAGGGGAAEAPPDLVIAGVNVVDVVDGVILEDRTVTVRDGRITGVLEAGAAVPGGGAAGSVGTRGPEAADGADGTAAARVIDGAGKYLIPGLWDAHVHFRGGEELVEANAALLPLYVANGVTTVRDAGGDITQAILRWRAEIAEGSRIGPRILTSGPKLDGPTGGWDGSIRLTSPEEVPAALDSLEALGVDYVKIYDGTTSRDVYLAIVEEAERRDMIVTGHMPFTVRFLDAVERGLDATEHLYYAFKGTAANGDSVTAAMIASRATDRPLGFWQALWLLLDAPPDPAREAAVYRAMAEHGTAAVPTLHIGHVLAWVDEVDHSGDAELRYIDPAIEATYAGRVRSARRSSAETRRRTRELRQRFTEMVPRMHEAGVMLLAGSDAGPFNSYVYPGYSLHAELEALVDAGLTPLDALRAATLHPAAFMRLDDELGRIAPGYRADLVLLDGNPLADIANTRSISTVVLGGDVVLDAGELEALLEGVARRDAAA